MLAPFLCAGQRFREVSSARRMCITLAHAFRRGIWLTTRAHHAQYARKGRLQSSASTGDEHSAHTGLHTPPAQVRCPRPPPPAEPVRTGTWSRQRGQPPPSERLLTRTSHTENIHELCVRAHSGRTYPANIWTRMHNEQLLLSWWVFARVGVNKETCERTHERTVPSLLTEGDAGEDGSPAAEGGPAVAPTCSAYASSRGPTVR